MRQRLLRASTETLVKALNLPEDTTIHDLRYLVDTNEFEFRVEHEAFEDVPPGRAVPMCKLSISVEFHYCPVDSSTWLRYHAFWG